MFVRVGKSALVAAVLLALTAAPASAKMPPFELEVETFGDTAVVTVEVGGFDPKDLDGLVGVYPANDLDDQGRPLSHLGAKPVSLQRVDDGVYRGVVAIDTQRRWAVVLFPTVVRFDPQSAIHAAYPRTTMVPLASAGGAGWPGTAVAAGIGVLIFGVVFHNEDMGVRRRFHDMLSAVRITSP